MTEAQAMRLKDLFYRIKQFYYGVSDTSLYATNLSAGEASEYIAALKEAEAEMVLPLEGRVLPPDAEKMLLYTCALTRAALKEKNIRLAGDLSALGIRLLGVYTFPFMGRGRFWKTCMLPFRDRHGDDLFAELEEEFLAGPPTALRLSPSFGHGEGRYYDDDADEALKLAHPIWYAGFVLLGVLLFFGSIVAFGFVAGRGFSLSSPYLILGYLGAAAFGTGLYSLAMTFVRQYMGHLITGLLTILGAIAMIASVLLAL